VAVVRIREIAGTRACGATRWINATYPIIVLSGRYNVEDSLWFSFFHEAGHVILHPKKATYIRPDTKDGDQDELEDQADQFSRSTLIPEELTDQLPRLATPESVRAFARQIGVDPGIVAGRLMNDGFMSWSHKHRRKISD
jgi:HTH-type transcriptional regulator / antitoxin HigA